MWEDPIVEEIHKTRNQIEGECNNDFAKLFEKALVIQKECKKRLVSKPVKYTESSESDFRAA